MGGLAIKLDMFQSLALAVIAIWLGNWCRQKFPFLRKYCLPGAVGGGTIISLISLVLYETGVAELSFDYKVANRLFYCIFFAASGAAASLSLLKKGGKLVIIFTISAAVLAILQNVLSVGIGVAMGVDPLIALMTGSTPMTGGHGNAAAFAPLAVAQGASAAMEVAIASAFFGMIAGYLLALAFGMVDFSSVTNTTAIVAVPQFMHFLIKFVPSACISLAIVYIVNSVQTIGDLTSTTMGGMDRVPTNRELQGGILTQGVMSIFGAFFGGLPTATYSQNVGIVTVNKVINRIVFLVAAVILMIAGFIPVFSAALTTIPQSGIGGATLSVFAQIAMTGVRMFTKD